MYSNCGSLCIGVDGLSPNVASKVINFTELGGIRIQMDVKDVMRLFFAIKHDVEKLGMDFESYTNEMFDKDFNEISE